MNDYQRVELSPELRNAMRQSRHATQFNQQPRGRPSPYGNPRPEPTALRSTSTHERDPIEEQLELPPNYLEQQNIPEIQDVFHSDAADDDAPPPLINSTVDRFHSTGARPRVSVQYPVAPMVRDRAHMGGGLNPVREYDDELDPPEPKYRNVQHECPICGEQFDDRVELNLHVKDCSKSCYRCEHCGKEVKTKAGLVNHVRFMHTRKNAPKKKST